MTLLFKILVLIIILLINITHSAKILGIFPSPGYSQFILCEKLMTAIAKKGHEVTVISLFEPRHPPKNYRTILADGMLKSAQDQDLFQQSFGSIFENILSIHSFGYALTESILSDPKVQKLLNSPGETFDLVVMEQFFNNAHTGFAHHFKAPLILFSSIGPTEWSNYLIGNGNLPSLVPVSFTDHTNEMSFLQRLRNTIANSYEFVYKHLWAIPKHQELLTKYIPGNINLKEVMYNASLMLLNSHATTTNVYSIPATMVEIGGYHVQSKKLPQDLQQILDGSKDGAVLFSMGSNLESKNIPKEKLEGILKALGRINQTVFWKFEDINLKNRPKNVYVSKWLPQTDILAHPNVKAFITHCGLLSKTEAIHFGVPMVAIPIFGDQYMNAAKSVQDNIAVKLSYHEITEESFYQALNEILYNPKYMENAKSRSMMIRDRPVPPIELATYWVDYVLKYKGAPHLKYHGLELAWYQTYLLDVIGFLFLTVICSLYLLMFVFRMILNKLIFGKTTNHDNIVKKQKKTLKTK